MSTLTAEKHEACEEYEDFRDIAEDTDDEFDTEDAMKIDCSTQPELYTRMPRIWSLAKRRKGVFSSHRNISTPDGVRLNAVTSSIGHALRSDITIHAGPDADSAPLAVTKSSVMSFTVSLFGLSHGEEIPVRVRWKRCTTPKVTWTMQNPAGQTYDFEWKRTKGTLNLFRTGQEDTDIVATWFIGRSTCSTSREFEFVGAGLDEMGPAFGYVATLSALKVRKMIRDSANINLLTIIG